MTTPRELEAYFDRLWSIWPPRSLTGSGARQTHDILEEISQQKFTRIEVASGARCFDWTIPAEWKLSDAYIITPDGRKICDARVNHLHVVGYSTPFRGVLSKQELEVHLHSLPENPAAIPYRTTYYVPTWGFCIAHKDREALAEGTYQVLIDAEHFDGSLTLSECVLPGESGREILLWTYTCHPAGAHHDLSANLAWAALIRRVAAWPRRRFTYRFVAGAETIGSLAYLAQEVNGVDTINGPIYAGVPPRNARVRKMELNVRWSLVQNLKQKMVAGYVMTCLGRGAWNYKRSQRGDTLADRAAEYVMDQDDLMWSEINRSNLPPTIHDYYVREGSDELVFNRFGLPVGSLMRDRYAHFDSYHTDQDNKAGISFDTIADSVDVYERVLRVIEANRTYRCIVPGVPQLGRRGLYDEADIVPMTVLYQLSDGSADLLDLAQRTGLDIHVLADAAKRATAAGVLEEA